MFVVIYTILVVSKASNYTKSINFLYRRFGLNFFYFIIIDIFFVTSVVHLKNNF